MQSLTGRMFCPEERSREWEWHESSTTGPSLHCWMSVPVQSVYNRGGRHLPGCKGRWHHTTHHLT
ncbi:hypothetical protein GBAR_LOCUS1533 [Geodia barretti]|uniref:Uncharacterized protein n=1 Tax=Geodia barretti TaxID=519541 RepID=A0AA35VVY9_GEOBA|nr:hypothetical protein GBAR_LOCUS1533 [Geodia barretti]